MKNNKKLVISMATCAFVASLGFGIAATTVSADTEVTPLTVSQITATPTMKSGAEMRIDNTYNGLRFTMYVEDSTYASLQASGNVTYGMLIAPEDYVATYGALDLEGNYVWGNATAGEGQAKILNVYASELIEGTEGDGLKEFRGVIYGILEENFDRNFVGVGYVKDSTGYKMATVSENARSVTYMAQSALNDANEGGYASLTGTEAYLARREILKNWASTTCYSVNFTDDYGDVVKQQWVKKGTAAGVEAPAVTARDLYDFEAWTYADGTAYNAESLVTANTVVKQNWNVKPLNIAMDNGADTGTLHMHVGAERSVQLNGQKLIMSYDVQSSTIGSSWMGGFMIERDPENMASNYPYINKGSTFVFANYTNGAVTQSTGREDTSYTVTSSGSMSVPNLYSEGYSYKIEYQPYVSDSQLGGISIYRKLIVDTTYELWVSLSGFGPNDAPDKASLYLSNYWDASCVLHNFTIETEDGNNLGIKWGGVSGTTVSVAAADATYTIEGSGSLVFGSGANVTIAQGDTLEMQFDILSFTAAKSGNFGVTVSGYKDSIGSWGSATTYLNANSFMTYINYLSSADVVFTGKGGSVNPTKELSSGFSYSNYMKAGNTIKVVYKPYVSDEDMGWLKFYKKTTGSSEDWTLGYTFSGLDAGYAPSTYVKIGIVSYSRTDLKMEVTNFRIKNGKKTVPIFGTYGGVTITEGLATEEA